MLTPWKIFDMVCIFVGTHCKYHADVTKWKRFARYWLFVRGIHRSTVNSRHRGQWRGASIFSLICVRINTWVNSREAGDLRRHRVHYDDMCLLSEQSWRRWFEILSGSIWRHCNDNVHALVLELCQIKPICCSDNNYVSPILYVLSYQTS